MVVFIRADGGISIGLGHVMRTLVLAHALKNKKYDVIFLCRDSSDNKFGAGIDKIKENGFKVIKIDDVKYLEEIIRYQKEYNADMIITDSYDVDEEYFDNLKPHFKFTGYIDDVNCRRMNVDFIINQNINALDLDYSRDVNNDTKLLLGSKYCMIREEFRTINKKNITNDEVENILLTLGGSDANEYTVKLLNIVKNLNKKIHVVIGNAFKNSTIKDIKEIEIVNDNVFTYCNANMSELMNKCDIAISACGSTIYELCVLNIPTIGIVLADNQKDAGKSMKKNKVIFDLFDIGKLDSENFLRSINQLIEDKNIRNTIVEMQNEKINANGVCCVVNELQRLLKK